MTDSYQRYLNVKSLINELEHGKPTRHYGWFEQQNMLLEEYREYFGDFSDVRSSNPEFNKNIIKLNEIMCSLEDEFKIYNWFSLHNYLEMNKLLIWLVDCEDDDSLDNLFTNMTLSRETN